MIMGKLNVRVSTKGLNLDKFSNEVLYKYKAYDVERLAYDNMVFSVSESDYAKIKKSVNGNIKFEIIQGGKHNLFKNMLRYIGLALGIVLMLAFFTINSGQLYNIKVIGVDEDLKSQIVNLIHSSEHYNSNINNIDMVALQDEICTSVDNVSLISIVRRGNTLLVSIKQSELLTLEYSPIYARYNMVITHINVYQGTSNAKVGDIVKAGDIIVYPYAVSGEAQVNVEPNADIEGDVWLVGAEEFKKQDTRWVRTGQMVKLCDYSLFGYKFLCSNAQINFENYEIVEYNDYITNMYLPIMLNQTCVYEIVEEKHTRDFEQEKQDLIESSRAKAIAQMQMPCEYEESLDIVTLNDIIYVKTTLKFKIKV